MKKSYKHLLFSALILGCLIITGCPLNNPYKVQGYIEGRFTYVDSQMTGTLMKLFVERGTQIKQGQPLFNLEKNPELAEYNEAKAKLANAKSELQDLLKGKRPSELAAIVAQQKQTKAQIIYAKNTVERYQKLHKAGFLDKETLDQAIANYHNLQQKLIEYIENLKTAKLKARIDRIHAAQANVKAAEAALIKYKWQLQQKTIFSPISGEVFDRYYRIGEVVPAEHAILALLAPENVKVIFYVPEPYLSQVHLLQKIKVSCDSCKAPYFATVSFISPKAEYTPPVIYSRERREKLTYRIEARLSNKDAMELHPGQPVMVNYRQTGKHHAK